MPGFRLIMCLSRAQWEGQYSALASKGVTAKALHCLSSGRWRTAPSHTGATATRISGAGRRVDAIAAIVTASQVRVPPGLGCSNANQSRLYNAHHQATLQVVMPFAQRLPSVLELCLTHVIYCSGASKGIPGGGVPGLFWFPMFPLLPFIPFIPFMLFMLPFPANTRHLKHP